MSGLKFGFLTTFYPPENFGGDGIGIQRLARGLVKAGHQVTVIHDLDAYHALHPGPPPAAPAEPPGLEVVKLRSGVGTLSPLLTQQTGRPVMNGRKIAALLAAHDFDVITFHNVSLIGGPGLLKYGHALKLYMAHEHWLVCPSHVLWRYDRELCDARDCVRCQLSFKRPPQAWRATGYLERELRHVDTFIAMSEFSRKKHAEFGFPRDMEVLPYFLPDPEAGGARVGGARPQERPYFLFVGRLEKIKGLDDVIPVFRQYPDADLLIAGDGEYAGPLKALAAGLPNVKFLGRVAPEELRRIYEHAIALVVPSVCFETFGIILIEAFKQGTPVIARRLGPFPEIVETAGGGELFSTTDELVAAMRRLQDDPARRDRLAEAGSAAFLQRWSESAVVPQFLDIVARSARKKGDARVLGKLGLSDRASGHPPLPAGATARG
ncbi:MAG: glycosyltransferase family 4 protein [Gemmatimonadetes bacterium]|nr:glycosyltransferase family 4 protein [Gemmatimonadota bacterium]